MTIHYNKNEDFKTTLSNIINDTMEEIKAYYEIEDIEDIEDFEDVVCDSLNDFQFIYKCDTLELFYNNGEIQKEFDNELKEFCKYGNHVNYNNDFHTLVNLALNNLLREQFHEDKEEYHEEVKKAIKENR